MEDREIINKAKAQARRKQSTCWIVKFSVLVYETPETCEADSRLVEREGAGGVERGNEWGYMWHSYC